MKFCYHIPAIKPFVFEEILAERHIRFVDMMKNNTNRIAIKVLLQYEAEINVVVADPPKSVTKFLEPYRKFPLPVTWFKFETEIQRSIIDRIDKNGLKNNGDKWHRGYIAPVVSDSIEDQLRKFFVSSNIGYPGCFRNSDGVSVIGGRIHKLIPPFLHTNDEALITAYQSDWPKLKDIDIFSVWAWASRLQGFQSGISKGRICRALNAFSYLFSDSLVGSEGRTLLWNAIGIEALLTTSSDNVLRQIIDNGTAILGNESHIEKVMKDMYKYRSKYLHGQMDIPNKFNEDDISVEKFVIDSGESESRTQSIFLSLLQNIAEKNLDNIEFSKYTTISNSNIDLKIKDIMKDDYGR